MTADTSALLGEADLAALAETFRVLGHETRMRLLDALRLSGELSVGELEQKTGIAQPGLSQQLAVLRKAELVTTRRSAKQVYYSLDAAAFEPVALIVATFARRKDGEQAGSVAEHPRQPTRGSAAMFARIIAPGR